MKKTSHLSEKQTETVSRQPLLAGSSLQPIFPTDRRPLSTMQLNWPGGCRGNLHFCMFYRNRPLSIIP